MYRCCHCGKSYKWACSLYRHRKVEHGDEPVELEGEEEDSEMDTIENACPHCGVLFASNSSLAKHKETCPQKPLPTCDIFGPIDDNDEENEEVWVYLIRYINRRVKDEFEEKKQEYIVAGKSEEKAHLLAKKDFKETFKEKMKLFAKNSLMFTLMLRNSRYFEEIMEDIIYFKKEKELDWDKAVAAALDRNFDVFGKVLKAKDIARDVKGEDTDTEDSLESDDMNEEVSSEEEADEMNIFP